MAVLRSLFTQRTAGYSIAFEKGLYRIMGNEKRGMGNLPDSCLRFVRYPNRLNIQKFRWNFPIYHHTMPLGLADGFRNFPTELCCFCLTGRSSGFGGGIGSQLSSSEICKYVDSDNAVRDCPGDSADLQLLL